MKRMSVIAIGVTMNDEYPLVAMLSMRSRYMMIEWIRRYMITMPDDHDA